MISITKSPGQTGELHLQHSLDMGAKSHALPDVPPDGTKRVIIKNVLPSVADGKYPAKGAAGTPVKFIANIIADGHDKIYARVLLRYTHDKSWQALPLKLIENDRWEASYLPEKEGIIEFKIQGWVSELRSWEDAFEKKMKANADTALDELHGVSLLQHAIKLAPKAAQKELKELKDLLSDRKNTGIKPTELDEQQHEVLVGIASKEKITATENLRIQIERKKAQFSTWYELFPRSCSAEAGRHGTFKDVINKLPEISEAGFDVLYLPPVHPIGKMKRKGKNNALIAGPDDPGSPWAIGSDEGGHKSIHPELGTMDDFRKLIKEARKHNMEIAMDIAFQCAPDHPYVKDHPEWFKWRADGSVQFAENPPKKYEDIIPFDFESEAWPSLWKELLSIFLFWIDKGVTVFRVDNPHTKPLRLWEWIIGSVHKDHPDIIFLAEAFTRPNIMEHLAMIGFTQSYTYFTWRNTKQELQDYVTELTKGPKQYFFRPNFWPNTPDILPDHLVKGGENMHVIRLLLAATLSSNYGIYGPVYERAIHQPTPGKEEYYNNEKYEIKYWEPVAETRIWGIIKRINHTRKAFAALQITNNIRFLNTSNDQIMAYLKLDKIHREHLLVVINLDPANTQSAWINIPKELMNNDYDYPYHLYDHLDDTQYQWNGDWNYVELNPYSRPGHVFSFKSNRNN